MYIMVVHTNTSVRYAPLLIRSFRLVAPRKLSEAQAFLGRYRCYEEIGAIADKLRWCRHQHGWMQSEVAEKIGVSCTRYQAIEAGEYNHIPLELVDKLATLYGIGSADLLDDYGRFLQYGAARFVQEYRERLGMTRTAFAKMLGVQRHLLADWEAGKKEVSRKSWEKHFREQQKRA